MANLVSIEKVSLKNHPEIKEDTIQAYIFEHPEILGLGELTALKREKSLPSGGRLDLLLVDSEEDTRYEVEIMLGATDPSHIIRTIEYWDIERKRYPKYNHCAVIVAEEITGRFMNVISLFNGAIPLIALQMSAFKAGNDISLTFTKVIDRIDYGDDEEDEIEVKDRNYWETTASTPKILKQVDAVFEFVKELAPGYALKYNKFYIGLEKEGVVKNFVSFRPKKSFFYLCIKTELDQEVKDKLETAGLEVKYENRWREYRIRMDSPKVYENNRDVLDNLVKSAMQHFNLS